MNKELLEVFKNVNDWLKFAEAKNAMIIRFNGVIIFGIKEIKGNATIKNFDTLLNIYINIAFILLALSTVISLLSFLPRLKKTSGFYTSKDTANRWFFEYLKKMREQEIIDKIANYDDNSSPTPLDRDLANQIKQNSIRASEKYSHFTVAIWLTMSAIITPILALILGIYSYTRK